jgi:hypothetical protein
VFPGCRHPGGFAEHGGLHATRNLARRLLAGEKMASS